MMPSVLGVLEGLAQLEVAGNHLLSYPEIREHAMRVMGNPVVRKDPREVRERAATPKEARPEDDLDWRDGRVFGAPPRGYEGLVAGHVEMIRKDPREVRERESTPRGKSDPITPSKGGRMTPGEQMILTALIQYPKGLTREQLTVMTMYKRSSRDTYLAKLKVRGFIEGAGERAVVTDAGKKAMPHAKPLPTGRKLREWVMSELPQGERNVLQALLDAHPYAMQRDEIDKVTGYKRSSRDTYLSKLQARELVFRDDASSGAWRPSRTLFDGMGGLSR